jgi:hypothetical protein
MKVLFFIVAGLASAIRLPAADTNAPAPLKIGTLAATNFYGQTMIVTGRVAQVTVRPAVTFLNLDEKFPDSPFSVVIIHGHSQFFGDANALRGKSIEVEGKIKNYKGKPEIALDSTNQLTVVGVTNLSRLLNPPAAAPPVAVPPTNAPASLSETNFPEIM